MPFNFPCQIISDIGYIASSDLAERSTIMLRIFRAWRDRAVTVLTQVDALSPHLRKDLNLWQESEEIPADSIRNRNLRHVTSF
jgi:hypothetical protein